MISAAGIKDQELAVIAERPGVNNPAITGSGDLPPGRAAIDSALFGAPDAVRSPEFPDFDAIDRQRQHSLGCGKAMAQSSLCKKSWLRKSRKGPECAEEFARVKKTKI